MPIYNSTKCKAVATVDDPWARKFIENNSAGFGPYRLDQLQRGQQVVFGARPDYYLGKPPMETVISRPVVRCKDMSEVEVKANSKANAEFGRD